MLRAAPTPVITPAGRSGTRGRAACPPAWRWRRRAVTIAAGRRIPRCPENIVRRGSPFISVIVSAVDLNGLGAVADIGLAQDRLVALAVEAVAAMRVSTTARPSRTARRFGDRRRCPRPPIVPAGPRGSSTIGIRIDELALDDLEVPVWQRPAAATLTSTSLGCSAAASMVSIVRGEPGWRSYRQQAKVHVTLIRSMLREKSWM